MKKILLGYFLLFTGLSVANAYETEITVAQDGSGDFTSIQEAIYATKAYPPDEPVTIYIMDGVYEEKVDIIPWNTNLSLIGESRDGTIITNGDYFDQVDKGRNSTYYTFTLKVAANDFVARNLTVVNSAGPAGQAVALHVEADRAVFSNVALKGYQDTLYIAGEGFRTYFKDCYVEGSTDFIFGQGTALFEGCTLKSLTNSFVTAASTTEDQEYGFVFKNCELIAAEGVDEVYLGRPWRSYARTVFIDSFMDDHIVAEGWDNWGSEANEETAYYAEYGNYGPGAGLAGRADWIHKLNHGEVIKYTQDRIFRGWVPEGEEAHPGESITHQ